MQQDLTEALKEYHCNVNNFQLLEIGFPAKFTEAITETQKEDLGIQGAIFNRSKVRNLMSLLVFMILQAENIAEGKVRRAETEADVILNNAEVEATKII